MPLFFSSGNVENDVQVLVENNAQTIPNKDECIIEVIGVHKNILTDYEQQHSSAFCDESNVITESEWKTVSVLIQEDKSLENQNDDNTELPTIKNTSEGLVESAQSPCKKIKLESIGFSSSSPSTSSKIEISTTSGIVNNKLQSKVVPY